MELNNSEIEKIRSKTCEIFDELIKNSSDDNISEEKRDAEYTESVEKILYSVEEIIEG